MNFLEMYGHLQRLNRTPLGLSITLATQAVFYHDAPLTPALAETFLMALLEDALLSEDWMITRTRHNTSFFHEEHGTFESITTPLEKTC